MKFITYITTNLINGKQYVGDHSTNNLDDDYLGSGTILKLSIKKYGKQNFKRKILEQCDTKQKAFNLQEKYINKYNTLVPYGYNISPKGGHGVMGCMSNSTKEKISNANKGKNCTIETKRKIRLSLLGHTVSQETRQKISKKSKISQLGHTVSQETRQKIRESKIGIKNPMFGKKFTNEEIQRKSGWHHTDKAKIKIGIASKENISKYTKERSKKIWETRRRNGNDTVSIITRKKISDAQIGKIKKIKI